MAKFSGLIGFAVNKETSPGVWKPQITELPYFGDVISDTIEPQPTNQLNDDIKIANKISIVSNPFADKNFYAMRYVKYMGAKWKIVKVEVLRPRLILTIGGVYNGG